MKKNANSEQMRFLRNTRAELNLTQAKMAELLHISTHACSELENGKTFPSAKTLAFFLHDALNIQHPYLDALVEAFLSDEENEM